MQLSWETLNNKAEELAAKIVKTDSSRRKTLESIKLVLDSNGDFIERGGHPLDMISQIKNAPEIIVDFSVDTDIEAQQRTSAYILSSVR